MPLSEKLARWLAWILPRRVVYWCAIRLGSAATRGPWSHQIVPDLTLADALQRWDKCQRCGGEEILPPTCSRPGCSYQVVGTTSFCPKHGVVIPTVLPCPTCSMGR